MAEERIGEFASSPKELVSAFVVESEIPHDRHLTIVGEELRIVAGRESREMAWNKIRKVFAHQRSNGSDNVQSAGVALNNPELSFAELMIGLTEGSREMQLRLPDAEIRWALWQKAHSLEFAMTHRHQASIRHRRLPRSESLGAFSTERLATGISSLQKFKDKIYAPRGGGRPARG